jgi:enoyl-CoA hydratase/carnithine racemase
VVSRVQDGIQYITIMRANKRNCVNHDTAQELIAAFEQFDKDADVRVAILRGDGIT